MPLHLFREESLGEFQTMIREMFLADDRVATKTYLKLFIETILINLPRIDITCKSNVLLAAPENKTAVRSGEVLTADMYWLQRTYSCRNFITTLFMNAAKHRYQMCPDSKISILTNR
jgi:hypothetical protein